MLIQSSDLCPAFATFKPFQLVSLLPASEWQIWTKWMLLWLLILKNRRWSLNTVTIVAQVKYLHKYLEYLDNLVILPHSRSFGRTIAKWYRRYHKGAGWGDHEDEAKTGDLYWQVNYLNHFSLKMFLDDVGVTVAMITVTLLAVLVVVLKVSIFSDKVIFFSQINKC